MGSPVAESGWRLARNSVGSRRGTPLHRRRRRLAAAADRLRPVRPRAARRRQRRGPQQRHAGLPLARSYLIDQLKPIATGLNTARDRRRRLHPGVPGRDQHRGRDPRHGPRRPVRGRRRALRPPRQLVPGTRAADTICNGATDNATGVAAALGDRPGDRAQPTRPRRSVIIAFWDSEEDGLLGSHTTSSHPLVPLAKTVAYVNFDIQGANLLPEPAQHELRGRGRDRRRPASSRSCVGDRGSGRWTRRMLSSIFGQGRSDYVTFIGARRAERVLHRRDRALLPHGRGRDRRRRLRQARPADRAPPCDVTRELANTGDPARVRDQPPVATYDDAVGARNGSTERLWGRPRSLLARRSRRARRWPAEDHDDHRAQGGPRSAKGRSGSAPQWMPPRSWSISSPTASATASSRPAEQQQARVLERFTAH